MGMGNCNIDIKPLLEQALTPALLASVLTVLLTTLVTGALLLFAIYHYCLKNKCNITGMTTGTPVLNRHIVVTGGTEGIGLSIVRECLRRRAASVSILARTQAKYDAIKSCLESSVRTSGSSDGEECSKFEFFQCDVCDALSIEAAINKVLVYTSNRIDMLINCAGFAICDVAENITNSEFKTVIDTNLLGSIMCTRQVLPVMQSQSSGTICMMASQAAQLGLYGYSAYSASKFGLVGFAQALSMELLPFNVKVAVAYPADVATPGYANENRRKPEITKKIASTSGLAAPDTIAHKMINDLEMGVSRIVFGLEGHILDINTASFNPPCGLFRTVVEIYAAGISRIIALALWHSWTRMLMGHQETTSRVAATTTTVPSTTMLENTVSSKDSDSGALRQR